MEDGEYFCTTANRQYKFVIKDGAVFDVECARSSYPQTEIWRGMDIAYIKHYLTSASFELDAKVYYETKLMSLKFDLESAERAYRREMDYRIAGIQSVKVAMELTKDKLKGLKNV